MRMTAAQKRADRKRLEKVRREIEYTSYKNAPIEVRCPKGHPQMKSHCRYNKRGDVVSVLWICTAPGCQERHEVNPKKMREDRVA